MVVQVHAPYDMVLNLAVGQVHVRDDGGGSGTRVVDIVEVRWGAGCVRKAWLAGEVKRRKGKMKEESKRKEKKRKEKLEETK